MINYQYIDQLTSDIRCNKDDFHKNFMFSVGRLFHGHGQRPELTIPNQPTKSFLASHPFYGRRPKSRQPHENILTLDNHNPTTAYEETLMRTMSSPTKEAHYRNVNELHQIISKLPLERSRKEKKRAQELFQKLCPEEVFSTIQYSDKKMALQHLIQCAVLVTLPSVGLPVFGNNGVFMVLRGCVRATSGFNKLQFHRRMSSRNSMSRRIKLHLGDCFGTFEKPSVVGIDTTARKCIAVAAESTDLLQISVRDHDRIMVMLRDQELADKTSLIQSCECYSGWPGLSVKALASCVKWQHFPADSIILNEGEISPFIGFIRSGLCQAFKQVEAMKTLPNGRKVKWHKQVHLGTLSPGQSVGEESMLSRKLLTFAVIACTDVEMARLDDSALLNLDETTRVLLIQSARAAFSSVSMDQVQQKFVEQEMKLEWQKLKQKTLLQTVNYCGIRPGCGKWKH